jgi:site-specific recombinase XerD
MAQRTGGTRGPTEPMKYLDEYISPDEFDRLISFAENERDRVLLTVFYNTGRRVSEVVNCLHAKDISAKSPNVYFTILKKRAKYQAWIRVSDYVIELLRTYSKDMQPDDYVFPITRRRVDQVIKAMGEKAGMLNFQKRMIHVHMLRHSFAVNRASKCKNMMELKRLQMELQHSDINMTSYYMEHFIPDEAEVSE